jgi:hypothetical protein
MNLLEKTENLFPSILRLGRKGQSTVEFALTLIFLLGFTFFFLQLAMVFAYSNYVQYATFMAARALQSAGPSVDEQEERARSVITSMTKRSEGASGLDRWPILGKGIGGDPEGAFIGPRSGYGPAFSRENNALSWQEGVRYRFRSLLFPIPLGGGPESRSLELVSESWLGRDPSQEECIEDMEIRNRVEDLSEALDNGC